MDHREPDFMPARNEHRQHHRDFNRGFILGVTMVLFGGCFFFLEACDKMDGTREKETMAMTKMNSVPKVPIPPIDASVPAKTETATFALG